MNNETHKVRNTTLFLAELYIQLQNVSAEHPQCAFFDSIFVKRPYCAKD